MLRRLGEVYTQLVWRDGFVHGVAGTLIVVGLLLFVSHLSSRPSR